MESDYWTGMLLSHQEDSMGRRGYPAEFRQRVLDLIAACRRVRDVAADLGISEQTVYGWRRQERVDQGIDPGLTSAERAEAPPAGPGYLTIQFGRSIEGSYLGKGCVRAPGFLTLAEVAADLQARGSARRPRWWSIAQVRPPSVAKAVTSTRVGLIFKLLRRTAGHSSAMG